MNASVVKNLLKYALGLGLLVFVVWRNWEPSPNGAPGLGEVLRRPINLDAFALVFVLLSGALLLGITRWFILVRAQGLPFAYRSALRLGLVGIFFNTFLPGSVGGDFYKAAAIAGQQSRRTVAVATVIADRLLGLWALIWFTAILGCIFWASGNPYLTENINLQTIVRGAVLVVIVSTSSWLLLGLLPERRATRFAGRLQSVPKLGGPLAELWRAVWMYRQRSRAVLAAMGLSWISQTGFVLAFHFASRTFQTEGGVGSFVQHFVVVPVGLVVQAVFPAPGGVGGGEYGFGKLYTLLGCPESNGVLMSLAQRVVMLLLGATGFLVYLWMKQHHELPTEPTDTEPTHLQTISPNPVDIPPPTDAIKPLPVLASALPEPAVGQPRPSDQPSKLE